ncbi:MAG: hypothetical protein ACLQDY_28455 [Streptosporangiaceae bacterium]
MPTSWLARRRLPVLAAACLAVIAMASTIWWGPRLVGRSDWSVPDDLWGTLVAARRLMHLDLAGLYTRPTALITFPGAAVILVPAAAAITAAGLSLAPPGSHNPHPGAWLIAGPYVVALSAVALLAADALAERLGASGGRRALLAAASTVALWNVAMRWGHPEDAVAVGLFLFALLALADSRTVRAAWLAGAAVAVQPLVLLALPVACAVIERRRLPGFLGRAAVPSAALLGAAAVANWSATLTAVTSQPNWPAIDHPTPWAGLAPRLGHGAVAAGPARAAAILAACGCAVVVGRRWRGASGSRWSPVMLREVLWWTAVALGLRCAFEPVIVAYYFWPALAAALIAAAPSWPGLAATAAGATVITFVSQLRWPGPWGWWSVLVAALGLTLACAWPRAGGAGITRRHRTRGPLPAAPADP